MDEEAFRKHIATRFPPPNHFEDVWARRFPDASREILATPPSRLTPTQVHAVLENSLDQCAYVFPRALELIASLPLDEVWRVASSVVIHLSLHATEVSAAGLLEYPLHVLHTAFEKHLSTATVESAPDDPPAMILPFLLREGRWRDDLLGEFMEIENAHSIPHPQRALPRYFVPPFPTMERACHLLDLAVMTKYHRANPQSYDKDAHELYYSAATLALVEDRDVLQEAWGMAGSFMTARFPEVYKRELREVVGVAD